jgi:hypothetical protein
MGLALVNFYGVETTRGTAKAHAHTQLSLPGRINKSERETTEDG